MFKKMLLLASMALAVVAVAAPASALANWTSGGVPLEEGENGNLTFSGPANFASAAAEAGADANLTAAITLEGGTTMGTVTSVSATGCIGTGKLANTTCTSTFEGLPWTVDVDSANSLLRITNIKITNHYYSPFDPEHKGTPVQTTVLTGNILAHPDKRSGISTVTLTGENTVVNGLAPATVGGDLNASPAGVFGF